MKSFGVSVVAAYTGTGNPVMMLLMVPAFTSGVASLMGFYGPTNFKSFIGSQLV